MNDDDEPVTREFSTAEFAQRLGLPPGARVTSIGLIWFDLMSGTDNNTVRVRYRPGFTAGLASPSPSLEDRLRRLAAKWRSQARHPQRRFRPEEQELLSRHADELLKLVGGGLLASVTEREKEAGDEGDQRPGF